MRFREDFSACRLEKLQRSSCPRGWRFPRKSRGWLSPETPRNTTRHSLVPRDSRGAFKLSPIMPRGASLSVRPMIIFPVWNRRLDKENERKKKTGYEYIRNFPFDFEHVLNPKFHPAEFQRKKKHTKYCKHNQKTVGFYHPTRTGFAIPCPKSADDMAWEKFAPEHFCRNYCSHCKSWWIDTFPQVFLLGYLSSESYSCQTIFEKCVILRWFQWLQLQRVGRKFFGRVQKFCTRSTQSLQILVNWHRFSRRYY